MNNMESLSNIRFKVGSAFAIVFQVTRKVTFEVHYTIRKDGSHYLSTMANLFNQPKTDYNRCGQCQNEILPKLSKAYHFYRKWDKYQCKPITDEKVWKEMIEDVITLAEYYNCAIREKNITFNTCKEISKLPFKKNYKE